MLQALIHFIASLPGWLLGLIHWVWVHYFHHDPVVFGAMVLAALCTAFIAAVAVRNARQPR